MKRMLLIGATIFLSASLWAADVWRSSWSATNETEQNLCPGKKGFLHRVVVSSAATGTGSKFLVVSSTKTVGSTMTVVDTLYEGDYLYDIVAITTTTTKGMFYSNYGLTTVARVTILYDCY